ncbi:hypothetical protein BpHYR1_053701 [Brachionus plicatilis]|uniref:Uncharacterized protein n=1 Tax=Brachionus plicatilis TaxID=10195 RepID=A0A3M7PZ38_BRAPC|nr:hypothetical protein BpHYR1_053701 [Brachionus plicatilis]
MNVRHEAIVGYKFRIFRDFHLVSLRLEQQQAVLENSLSLNQITKFLTGKKIFVSFSSIQNSKVLKFTLILIIFAKKGFILIDYIISML